MVFVLECKIQCANMTYIEGGLWGTVENGWNDEREEVRGIRWSLKSDDLVRNDEQQLYPTDDAPPDVIS